MKPNSTFAEVYDLTYDDLWYYCLRRTISPVDAEDVLGETFAIAWQKFDDLPAGRDARPWIFTIAANVLRNHNRKHKRRERVHLRLIDDAENSSLLNQITPETMALNSCGEIEMAFRSLRSSDQEILALAAWEELTNREIGQTLGCSELAARSRLHRARKEFDRSLQKLQQTNPPQQLRVEEASKHRGLNAK